MRLRQLPTTQCKCANPVVIMNKVLRSVAYDITGICAPAYPHGIPISEKQTQLMLEGHSPLPYSVYEEVCNNLPADMNERSMYQLQLNQYYVFDDKGNKYPIYMLVPCGSCPVCANRKSSEFSTRCELETMAHDSMPIFITLTADETQLPADGFTIREFQLFMKSLRRKIDYYAKTHDEFEVPTLRYACVSEFGEKKGRSHMHLLLWGWKINDPKDPVSSMMALQKRRFERLMDFIGLHGFVSWTPLSNGEMTLTTCANLHDPNHELVDVVPYVRFKEQRVDSVYDVFPATAEVIKKQLQEKYKDVRIRSAYTKYAWTYGAIDAQMCYKTAKGGVASYISKYMFKDGKIPYRRDNLGIVDTETGEITPLLCNKPFCTFSRGNRKKGDKFAKGLGSFTLDTIKDNARRFPTAKTFSIYNPMTRQIDSVFINNYISNFLFTPLKKSVPSHLRTALVDVFTAIAEVNNPKTSQDIQLSKNFEYHEQFVRFLKDGKDIYLPQKVALALINATGLENPFVRFNDPLWQYKTTRIVNGKEYYQPTLVFRPLGALNRQSNIEVPSDPQNAVIDPNSLFSFLPLGTETLLLPNPQIFETPINAYKVTHENYKSFCGHKGFDLFLYYMDIFLNGIPKTIIPPTNMRYELTDNSKTTRDIERAKLPTIRPRKCGFVEWLNKVNVGEIVHLDELSQQRLDAYLQSELPVTDIQSQNNIIVENRERFMKRRYDSKN